MFRILESQAPAKQTATDTINTLSGRLQSATLLEDRRAAILGLRSFAKLYPASVASGALRNLINSLGSDGEDVDTAKVVLETLLMLFSPDESSPEASDEVALWLADEFTQRQDNITILLDLLDRHDFYSRLYSLQLITAISSARPDRTQECVYTAPLGISRLVSVLDDRREAIRSEGLLLLVALTPSSPELQKLVAFENAFDRIFNIIEIEGSLSDGGIIVQDCLSLLANLLRLNVSNQSFFREAGGVQNVATVLRRALSDTEGPEEVPKLAASQRDKNLWGFLSIIRLLLNGGSVGTQMNQNSFWQHGVAFTILDFAFNASMAAAVRTEAFLASADLVRANSSLQEQFAQRDVDLQQDSRNTPGRLSSRSNGQANESTNIRLNVIQGLLDIALAVSSQSNLDVRLAACECLKAYLHGHAAIRLHFLRRARDGHSTEHPESDNILTILLHDTDGSLALDSYRSWIAAVILFNLLFDDYDTKKTAMEIVEGDADKGEETVTCIQALSGNLITQTQRGVDDRVTIGYLMVLIGWVFEDPDAVNDFLLEGANVQSLIQIILQPTPQKILETGLCTFLLGIIYEFSSKDSPVPRAALHDIMTTRLGREQYNDRLTKLREHPFVRDFEVLPQDHLGESGMGSADVYFDKTFVDFLKDNFSRIARAIDRDPSIEISVVANGIEKGISRELVDSLRSQLDEKNQNIQKAESRILNLEQKLGQEQADHRKAKESATIELNRIKSVNESLQRTQEEEHGRLVQSHRQALEGTKREHRDEIIALESRIQDADREYKTVSAKAKSRYQAELSELKSSIQESEKQKAKASKDHAQDLNTAHEEYTSSRILLESRLKRTEERAEEAETRATQGESRITTLEKLAEDKEQARSRVQSELDDLLMVLADLEEKRATDKSRLKALGEAVSDGEDEIGDEYEGGEEEEEQDEEEEEEEGSGGGDDGGDENGGEGTVQNKAAASMPAVGAVPAKDDTGGNGDDVD